MRVASMALVAVFVAAAFTVGTVQAAKDEVKPLAVYSLRARRRS